MYDSLSWLAYTAHVLSQKASSQHETQQQQSEQPRQEVGRQHLPASQNAVYRDGLSSEPHVPKAVPGIASRPGRDGDSDADYRCEHGSEGLEEGSSDEDVRRAASGAPLQSVSAVPSRRQRFQGRTESESAKVPGPGDQIGLGCCQDDQGRDRGRERQHPGGQLRTGRRAASPVIDGEVSYGCGGGDSAVSGGGKRSTGRRPVQFWAPFNDWWRSELQRSGKRPGSELVGDWYAAHAAACWGRDAPSLEETRTHAKCLRSVGSIREYFRNYRARKKARLEDLPTVTTAAAGDPPNSSAASAAKGPGAIGGAADIPGRTALPSFTPHLPTLSALSLSPIHLQLAAAAMAVASKAGTLDASVGTLQLGSFPESLQALASAATTTVAPGTGSDASRSAIQGLHGTTPDAVTAVLALMPSRTMFHGHTVDSTNSACKTEGGLQVLPLRPPSVTPVITVTTDGGLESRSPSMCVTHGRFPELCQPPAPQTTTIAARVTSYEGNGEARGGGGGYISTPRSGRAIGASTAASPPTRVLTIAGSQVTSERSDSIKRPSDISRDRYDSAEAAGLYLESGSARAAANLGSDGGKPGSSEPNRACNQGSSEIGKGSVESNVPQLPPGALAQSLLAAMQCIDSAAVVRINPRTALASTAALAASSVPVKDVPSAQDQERQPSVRTAVVPSATVGVITATAEDSEDLAAVQSASISDGCRHVDQSSPLAATAEAVQPFHAPSPAPSTPTERLGGVAEDRQANGQEEKSLGAAPKATVATAQELPPQVSSLAPPPPPSLSDSQPCQHHRQSEVIHLPVSQGAVVNARMRHSHGACSSGGGGTSSGTHTRPLPRHGYNIHSHNHCGGHSSRHGHSNMYPSAVTAGEVAPTGTNAADTGPNAAGTAMAPGAPSLGSLLARPDDEICGVMGGLQREQLEVLLLRAVAMVRQKRAHEERLMDELSQVLEQQGHLQVQLHSQRMETARMYRALMAMRDARGSSGGGVDGGIGMEGGGGCNTAVNVMASGRSSIAGGSGQMSCSRRQGFHSWSEGLETGEGFQAADATKAREQMMRRSGAVDAPCGLDPVGLHAADQPALATVNGPMGLWTVGSPRGLAGGATTVRHTTVECVPSVLLRGLSAPYDGPVGASRKSASRMQAASKLGEHDCGSDLADTSEAALTVLGVMGMAAKHSDADAVLSGGGSNVDGTANKMPAGCSDGGSGGSSAF